MPGSLVNRSATAPFTSQRIRRLQARRDHRFSGRLAPSRCQPTAAARPSGSRPPTFNRGSRSRLERFFWLLQHTLQRGHIPRRPDAGSAPAASPTAWLAPCHGDVGRVTRYASETIFGLPYTRASPAGISTSCRRAYSGKGSPQDQAIYLYRDPGKHRGGASSGKTRKALPGAGGRNQDHLETQAGLRRF